MAQQVWRPGAELVWTLVAHNADGIVVVDEAGQICFVNAAAARLFDKPADALLGQCFGFPVVGGDRAEVRLQRPGKPSLVAEMRIVQVDWEETLGYLVSLREMTERSDRQQQLEARARELELINQELEAFCQTVSHELWGYSRHIENYSQLLSQQWRESWSDGSRSTLQQLRTAAQRMKHLVEDLLQLSRIRYFPFHPQEINLSALAQTVMEYLRLAQPDRQVLLHIEPNMRVWGDERQLEAVLQNLLSNAWKYTRPSSAPQIELGQVKDIQQLAAQPTEDLKPGVQIYFVRDNGIGFEPQQAEQLFVPFYRLHHHQNYEGNGVGLAIAKRIIHRHGGQIWVHSEPQKGSIFYFTVMPDIKG